MEIGLELGNRVPRLSPRRSLIARTLQARPQLAQSRARSHQARPLRGSLRRDSCVSLGALNPGYKEFDGAICSAESSFEVLTDIMRRSGCSARAAVGLMTPGGRHNCWRECCNHTIKKCCDCCVDNSDCPPACGSCSAQEFGHSACNLFQALGVSGRCEARAG